MASLRTARCLAAILVFSSSLEADGGPLRRRGKASVWASRLSSMRTRLMETWSEPKARAEARALLGEARAIFTAGSSSQRWQTEVERIEAELELARQAAARGEQFRARAEDAPERLAKVEKALKEPPKSEPLPTRDKLDEELQVTEVELNRYRGELDRAELVRSGRTTRVVDASAEIEALEAELEDIETDLRPTTEEGALELAFALSRRLRLEESLHTLRAELAKIRAEQELLPKLVDLGARQVREAEARLTRLRQAANDYERSAAEQDLALAVARQDDLQDDPSPFLLKLAQQNVELAQRSAGPSGLVAEMRKLEGTAAEVETKSQELGNFFEGIRRLVQDVGLTPELGEMLRTERAELQNPSWIRRHLEERTAEVGRATVALFEIRNQRNDLSDPRASAERIANESHTSTQTPNAVTIAESLLETQQDLLDDVEKRYTVYIARLGELRGKERAYANLVEGFGSFLDARLVWIRSQGFYGPGNILELKDGISALLVFEDWRRTATRTLKAVVDSPILELSPLLSALLIGLVLWRTRGLWRPIRNRPFPSFRKLVVVLVAEIAAAGVFPLALTGLARWSSVYGLSSPTDAIAHTLSQFAALWFWLNLFTAFTRSGSFGQLDFRWPNDGLGLLHQNFLWLRPAMLTVWVPYGLIRSDQQEIALASLSRTGFLLFAVLLAFFVSRTLRPSGALMLHFYRRNPEGWLRQLRYPIYYAMMGIPCLLGLLALFGYFFTAMVLQMRLFQSLAVVASIVGVRAILLSWLRQTRRAVLRRKHAEAMEDGEEAPTRVILEQAAAELNEVDAQTRQVFRGLTLVALVAGLSLIWLSALPALETLDRIEIYPSFLKLASSEAVNRDIASSNILSAETSEPASIPVPDAPADPGVEDEVTTRVSLKDIMIAFLVLALTGAAVMNLPGLVEILLLQQLPLDRGTRYAVSTILRYVLSMMGLIATLDAISLGWSKIQWLAAALTFGLGFGLQEIFANFVSGIIILFERPIRIGDIVTVGETSGRVGRVNMRATTITDWDNKELLVPNRDFITQRVVNWTLSNQIIRVQVDVGVAYGSDVELALTTLREVALEAGDVVSSPAPEAFFMGFGDSALNLRLFVHIASVEERHRIRDRLHRAIDRSFRERHLTIAFPQLDIHLFPEPK